MWLIKILFYHVDNFERCHSLIIHILEFYNAGGHNFMLFAYVAQLRYTIKAAGGWWIFP